jgi:adenylate cyclase class 2
LIEAELKAIVHDVDAVSAALGQRAQARKSTYADRYFDYPDRRLTKQGRELRVRTITDDSGQTRVLLTYKEPALDASSDSKPEYETTVENANILVTVLAALGVEEFIAFQKYCVNYRFTAWERALLATVVTIPELKNQTFIEVETMVDTDDLNVALGIVRSVLRELGISENDLTIETYTDAVIAQRRRLGVE